MLHVPIIDAEMQHKVEDIVYMYIIYLTFKDGVL